MSYLSLCGPTLALLTPAQGYTCPRSQFKVKGHIEVKGQMGSNEEKNIFDHLWAFIVSILAWSNDKFNDVLSCYLCLKSCLKDKFVPKSTKK